MKKWISVLLAVTIAVSSAAIAFAASSETGDYGKLILNLDAASGYEIPHDGSYMLSVEGSGTSYTVTPVISQLGEYTLTDKDEDGKEIIGAEGVPGYWIPLVLLAPDGYEYYKYNDVIRPLRPLESKGIIVWLEAGSDRPLDSFTVQWLKENNEQGEKSPEYTFEISYDSVSIVNQVADADELQQAVQESQKGDKIVLTQPVTLSQSLALEEADLTLDLGGQVLTLGDSAGDVQIEVSGEGVSIGGGAIEQEAGQTASVFKITSGSLDIRAGTSFQMASSASSSALLDIQGGSARISSEVQLNNVPVSQQSPDKIGEAEIYTPTVPVPEPDADTGSAGDYYGNEVWSEVKREIADADEGDTIEVSATGLPYFPASVARELKGRDITLKIRKNGVTYKVNGLEISSIDKIWYEFEELKTELLTETPGDEEDSSKPADENKTNPNTGR